VLLASSRYRWGSGAQVRRESSGLMSVPIYNSFLEISILSFNFNFNIII